MRAATLKKDGLTLAELLLAIAIVGVLSAIAIPSVAAANANMHMVELDGVAGQILNTAQSQMKTMKTDGTWLPMLREEAAYGEQAAHVLPQTVRNSEDVYFFTAAQARKNGVLPRNAIAGQETNSRETGSSAVQLREGFPFGELDLDLKAYELVMPSELQQHAYQTVSSAQAAYLLGLAALLGACAGSFISSVAWRMVRDKTAFKGRSRCPQCGHPLGLFDLVPVFSWVFLRGRCRYCKAKIPVRYPLVEIALAVLFALIVWQWGIGIQAAAYCCLATILFGLALVDLETKRIPNGFILAGIVVWSLSVWFITVPHDVFATGTLFVGVFGYGFVSVLMDGLLGAFGIGGGMLVFSLLFDKVTRRTSLGGGDVKLFFMVGLFLGLAESLFNLLLACVLGLAFAFFWTLFQSRISASHAETETHNDSAKAGSRESAEESFKTKAFPFGPAIAAATILTLFVGPPFFTWYIGLIL